MICVTYSQPTLQCVVLNNAQLLGQNNNPLWKVTATQQILYNFNFRTTFRDSEILQLFQESKMLSPMWAICTSMELSVPLPVTSTRRSPRHHWRRWSMKRSLAWEALPVCLGGTSCVSGRHFLCAREVLPVWVGQTSCVVVLSILDATLSA